MNNSHTMGLQAWLSGSAKACIALGLTLLLSGCYWVAAYRDIQRDGPGAASHPWWCQGGTATLTDNQCLMMSASMDYAVKFAGQYVDLADFTGAGATYDADGVLGGGASYKLGSTTTFDSMTPNVIWYALVGGIDRPIAVGWAVDDTGGGAPSGFAGDQDAWTLSNGRYYLAMRVLRGYENHPDVFAVSHPCVSGTNSILGATTDACYTASHTVPVEIMVVNDDGIEGEGIDALVEGLKTVSGITIDVVAPATQQSGQGSNTTPPPRTASPGQTLSGEIGVAVNGTPADAVIYGTQNLLLTPDLVMSGINSGQNLATVGNSASGTIGAARRALMRGIPAVALSQGGVFVTPDFPAGVTASLALLENWRLGLSGPPYMELPNLNIPSCEGTGSITGTVETVVGVNLDSGPLNGANYFSPQNCSSTKTVFVDDLDAFLNGWITIADMGEVQPPNYP